MNSINYIYLLVWLVVSVLSTFIYFLHGDWQSFTTADLSSDILTPILLWIIAFFADYLFVLFNMDDQKQAVDSRWNKAAYFLTALIFITLLLSINFDGLRTLWVILLYICMIGLKAASLNVVCPRQKIRQPRTQTK